MPGPDFTILGAGLAGCLLARRLHQHNFKVKLCHCPLPGAASEVSPGILTPLPGRKFEPLPNALHAWPLALRTYRGIETELQKKFLHQAPVHRFFTEAEQPAILQRKIDAGDCAPATSLRILPPGAHGPQWQFDRFGSVEQCGGGWLDMAQLCLEIRSWFHSFGALVIMDATQANSLPVSALQGMVIDCTGWRAVLNPLWSFIEHNPARGEILTIRLQQGTLPQAVWHFGQWLQPLDAEHWKLGATYAWSGFDQHPTLAARSTLELSLRRWLNAPFKVVGHVTGTRPAMRDYNPVAGIHPRDPQHAICGGLGSHGALFAPALTEALAARLIEGTAIPAAWDCRRFRSRQSS